MHNNTDNVPEVLGGAIKSARLEKGITRAELAKRLGITPRHLGAIENDEKKPSFELLFHMIHELHITADRFFYPETEHDHLELEEIILALCQGDDKRINTILSALHSLIVENRNKAPKEGVTTQLNVDGGQYVTQNSGAAHGVEPRDVAGRV
jgi:transcriptional regulator with XRE-family HTH domain